MPSVGGTAGVGWQVGHAPMLVQTSFFPLHVGHGGSAAGGVSAGAA
ncbi:hypothetical protein [Humibacter sp.]